MTHTYLLHDTSRLPAVIFIAHNATPGYARRWIEETEALMADGHPYVVVYDQPRLDEAPEDRAKRAVWLKANKVALAKVCKGLVSIDPDDVRRAEIDAMGQIGAKAFGMPHVAVATFDEAIAVAHRLTGLTVIG